MAFNGEYRVPRSHAHLTHRAMRQEILDALEPVLFGRLGSAGAVRQQLESAFAAEVGQRHACAVHSGTTALFLALRACSVGPGNEVITVGNSDVSTTAAISHCGATPVLCDILESDYTINPELVEPLISPRTAAILPVDLYGHPADVKRLREVADRHGLKIVEDAALACGAADHGRSVGAFADATVFSFAAYKPLGCVGNGGMVTTDDDEIALRLRLLCGYGYLPDRPASVRGHQHHLAEGYNMPLDPLQAALLTVKLPHLREWTARRRAVARAYEEGLRGCDVQVPAFRPESEPTFRQYTVLVRDQRAAYEGLLQRGVEVVLHYVPAIYKQPVYAGRRLPGSDQLPVTERVTSSLVCLPVTPDLSEADVAYAVDALRALV